MIFFGWIFLKFYKSPSLSKKLTKKRQLIRFEMDLRLLKTNKLSDAEVAYAEADVHTCKTLLISVALVCV